MMVFWVFVLGCIGYNTMQVNQYLKIQYDSVLANSVHDRPKVVVVEKSSISRSGGDQICPAATKLFHPKSLEEMIEKAKDFHQRGGNLVSIENYLNGAIQQTLGALILVVVNKAAATRMVLTTTI
eukprot:CAMPEP_0170906052 /NCGR_PEP_ID=MMETSP0735-20130129/449_1 /TAXON_ID=186038 /ORGANISM="Fragilariopsis kerguelensis, Strain L26-C5" /LENGTH=124 /DNA_ID=CAMNT_0011301849 /DNA_START=1014 /DNA_END=1388 /DNA_ORIENTATION=-